MNAELPALSFPRLDVPVKIIQKRPHLYDPIRKMHLQLSPEEWVRQHCLAYLLQVKGYPAHRILVEREVQLNSIRKRFDIMVVGKKGESRVLVECKAPSVAIDQRTLDQASRYNLTLQAPLLWLTNGCEHYILALGPGHNEYCRLADLPENVETC